MTTAVDPWSDLRAAAATRAEAIGLPTRALEDWRYVDCAPLAQTFSGPAADLDTAGFADLDATAHADRWRKHLAEDADLGAAWSLSRFASGAQAEIAPGKQADLRVDLRGRDGDSGHRLVLRLGRGAAAHLVLDQRLGTGRINLGIEVDLADGARLTVEEVQDGDDAGQLLSAVWTRIGRDAALTWTASWRGGALVRARQRILLEGTGADLDLAGLGRVGGTRQVHEHLRVEHRVGDTRSRQLVKNVIDGAAKASFDGLVHVAVGADRSDAEQTNHNLLLSEKGRADTRPQLDIHADDVKAAHGATVGRPEDEEITYLRTRGLDLETARSLVQRGFSDEILHRFREAAAHG